MPSQRQKTIHILIGPAHPDAQLTLYEEAKLLNFEAYSISFPWELIHESTKVRIGLYQALRKLLSLNRKIQKTMILTRKGFSHDAAEMVEYLLDSNAEDRKAIFEPGDQREFLDIRTRTIRFRAIAPTHTVIRCSDYRLWKIHQRICRRWEAPRIISVPGEMQWFLNHPDVYRELLAWKLDKNRGREVPIINIKHGGEASCLLTPGNYYGTGCAYRNRPDSCHSLDEERQRAREECDLVPEMECFFVHAQGQRLLPLYKPAELSSRIALAG